MSNERSKQGTHAFSEESEMDKTVDTLPETQANDNASLATGAPKRQSRRKQPYPCRSAQWVLGIEPQALVQQNLATPRQVGASRWADDQPKVSMPVSEDGDQGPEEVPLTVPPSDGQPNAPMPVSEDGDRGPEEDPLTALPLDGQPKEPMPVSEDGDQGREAPPLTVPRSRSQRRKHPHPFSFIKRLACTEPQAPVKQNLATPSQFAEESEMDKTVDTLPETQANDNASLATGAPKRQSRGKQPYPCRSTQWVLGIEPQALVLQNLATPRRVGASRWADDRPKVSMPVSEDGDQGPEVIPSAVPPSDGQPKVPMPVSEDGDQGPEAPPLTVPRSRSQRRKQPHPLSFIKKLARTEPQAPVQQNLATPSQLGARRRADDQPKVSMPVSEDKDQGPEVIPLTAPSSDSQPKASMPVSEDGDHGPEVTPLTTPPSDGQPKASLPVSEDGDQGSEEVPLTALPSDGQPKASMSVPEDGDQGPEATPLTVPPSDEPEMTAAPGNG